MNVFTLGGGDRVKAVFDTYTAIGSAIYTPQQNFTLFCGKTEAYVTSATKQIDGRDFAYQSDYYLLQITVYTFSNFSCYFEHVRLCASTKEQTAISKRGFLTAYFPVKMVTVAPCIFLDDEHYIYLFKEQVGKKRAFHVTKRVRIDAKSRALIEMLLQRLERYQLADKQYTFQEVFEVACASVERCNGYEMEHQLDYQLLSLVAAHQDDAAMDFDLYICANLTWDGKELDGSQLFIRSHGSTPLGIANSEIKEQDAFGVKSELTCFVLENSAPFYVTADSVYVFQLYPFAVQRIETLDAIKQAKLTVFGQPLDVVGKYKQATKSLNQVLNEQLSIVKQQDEKLESRELKQAVGAAISGQEAQQKYQIYLAEEKHEAQSKEEAYPEKQTAQEKAEQQKLLQERREQEEVERRQQQERNREMAEKTREEKLKRELERQEALRRQIEAEKEAREKREVELKQKVEQERLQLQKEDATEKQMAREQKELAKREEQLKKAAEAQRHQLATYTREDGGRVYSDEQVEQMVEQTLKSELQEVQAAKEKHGIRSHLKQMLEQQTRAQEAMKREEEKKRAEVTEKHRRQQIEMQQRQKQKEQEEQQLLAKYNDSLDERKRQKQAELEQKQRARAQQLEEERRKQEEQQKKLRAEQQAAAEEKQQKYAEIQSKIQQQHEQQLLQKRQQAALRQYQQALLEERQRQRQEVLERRRIERQIRENELKQQTARLREIQQEREYQERARLVEEKQRVGEQSRRLCKTELRESKTRTIPVSNAPNDEEKLKALEFQDNLRKRRELAEQEYEQQRQKYEAAREKTQQQLKSEREERENQAKRYYQEELRRQKQWAEHQKEEYAKLEQERIHEQVQREMELLDKYQSVAQKAQEWAAFWDREEQRRKEQVEKAHREDYVCKDNRYSCYYEIPEIVCVQFKAGRGRRCKSQLARQGACINIQ